MLSKLAEHTVTAACARSYIIDSCAAELPNRIAPPPDDTLQATSLWLIDTFSGFVWASACPCYSTLLSWNKLLCFGGKSAAREVFHRAMFLFPVQYTSYHLLMVVPLILPSGYVESCSLGVTGKWRTVMMDALYRWIQWFVGFGISCSY